MPAQPPAPNPYGTRDEAAGSTEPTHVRPTGMILAAGTVLVIVLAVLGVTAFAYPGWMLDNPSKRSPHTSAAPAPGPRDSGITPEGTTNAALDRLNSGDLDGFAQLTCKAQRASMLRTVKLYDPRLTPVSGQDVTKVDVDYELEAIEARGPQHAVAAVSENFSNLPKNFDKIIPKRRFDASFDLTHTLGRWQLCGVSFTIPGEPSTTDEPEVTDTDTATPTN